MDVWKAVIYLATVMSHTRPGQEGIQHLLPRRVTNTGMKPTVATKELGGPLPRKEAREDEGTEKLTEDQKSGGVIGKILDEFETKEAMSRWIPLPRNYTKKEEKILIAKVVMVRIEILFSGHVYEFKGTL